MIRQFHSIEIFRVPTSVFKQKCRPYPDSPDIFGHLGTDKDFFKKGMLYFYFSHNMFWAKERMWDPLEQKIFTLDQLPLFEHFLQQNYPNDRIFGTLWKSYFEPGEFDFSGVRGIEKMLNRQAKIMIVNSEGLINVCSHDYGIEEEIVKEHYYLLELIVRIIGEKVDRGYDPLCEIVAVGLFNADFPKDEQNHFSSFLTKELYDPRLLLLINSFSQY